VYSSSGKAFYSLDRVRAHIAVAQMRTLNPVEHQLDVRISTQRVERGVKLALEGNGDKPSFAMRIKRSTEPLHSASGHMTRGAFDSRAQPVEMYSAVSKVTTTSVETASPPAT
jgi:hypothetical protein